MKADACFLMESVQVRTSHQTIKPQQTGLEEGREEQKQTVKKKREPNA
jgi:hypothetical protein